MSATRPWVSVMAPPRLCPPLFLSPSLLSLAEFSLSLSVSLFPSHFSLSSLSSPSLYIVLVLTLFFSYLSLLSLFVYGSCSHPSLFRSAFVPLFLSITFSLPFLSIARVYTFPPSVFPEVCHCIPDHASCFVLRRVLLILVDKFIIMVIANTISLYYCEYQFCMLRVLLFGIWAMYLVWVYCTCIGCGIVYVLMHVLYIVLCNTCICMWASACDCICSSTVDECLYLCHACIASRLNCGSLVLLYTHACVSSNPSAGCKYPGHSHRVNLPNRSWPCTFWVSW